MKFSLFRFITIFGLTLIAGALMGSLSGAWIIFALCFALCFAFFGHDPRPLHPTPRSVPHEGDDADV